MKKCITILMATVLVAVAATRVYDVELSGNDNATTPRGPDNWVGQTFIATCDSIQWAAFFVGRSSRAEPNDKYYLGIYDSTGGGFPLGEVNIPVHSDSIYRFLRGNFNPAVKVTKGVKYMLKVSHSGGDSVNFYFNRSDPYKYGRMVLPSRMDTIMNADLAARVEGITWVPKIFGIETVAGHSESPSAWDTCFHKAREASMCRDRMVGKFWEWCQPDSSDTCNFTGYPDLMMKKLSRDTIQTYISISNWPEWVRDLEHGWYYPLRLLKPIIVNNQINRENWLGYYTYNLVKRYCTNGQFWQENASLPYLPVIWYETINEVNGEWRMGKPDSAKDPQYDALWKRLRERPGGNIEESLYIWFRDTLATRFCVVVDSAAYLANADAKVLFGPIAGMWTWVATEPKTETGRNFIERFFSYGGGPHCEGYSINEYQEKIGGGNYLKSFYPPYYHNVIDTFRWLLRKEGYFDKEIYISEYGFPVNRNHPDWTSDTSRANAVVEAYTEAIAPSENIFGPVNNLTWFCFTKRFLPYQGSAWDYAISDSFFFMFPAYYSYKQFATKVKNYKFNNRIHINDIDKDTMARIYEFENPTTNKRFWVAWRNSGYSSGTIDVKIPVKTNSADTLSIDYGNNPSQSNKLLDAFGYMEVALDSSPIFILEPSDSLFKRPDMIVDSVWLMPNPPQVNNPVTFYARIKNIGNASWATDTIQPPFVDSICFYVNGDKVSDTIIHSRLNPGDTLTVKGRLTWTPTAIGNYLVKAIVNGTKVFMELSFDNNAKYRMYNLTYLPPIGSIKINGDEAFTNSPYGILDLRSYNPNKADSADADYMQIWQYSIAGAETTTYSSTWIAFDPHYKWRLCQNQGKNIVYAKFKITEGNLTSSEYKDSIIIDWTEAETLKMVINHDSLFTNSPTCTLCNHAVDLKTGICEMRFGNDSLVNLVKNSDMHADSFWIYHNTTFHDSLSLYLMDIQKDTNYFYQQIPETAITARDPDCYNGDTMRISGDLVLDHFKGSGRLEARLIFKLSGPGYDSTIGVVPYGSSITIPETTISKTSRYNLLSYFKFKPESTGYDFKRVDIGIFVRNSASDTGKIFIDNIRLEPVGPKYHFSKFVAYDTTYIWHLDSVNGMHKVYAQYQDSSGNETQCISDSIYLDISAPTSWIGSPYDSQTVNGTITIYGSAYDGDGHFLKYDLDYIADGGEGVWYPVKPDSEGWSPVYGMPPWGDALGGWWTDSVANGWYHLRVLTQDSAHNYSDYSVLVYVSNQAPPGGDDGFGGFAGEGEGMGLDKEGNLYLLAHQSPAFGNELMVKKFSPKGESLLSFSARLVTDSTASVWPGSIVIDDSLRIFLLDGLNHCLKIFDKTGKFLLKIGTRGTGQGQFINPTDLKWGRPKGAVPTRLFIVDRGNRRIQVLSKGGQFIRQFGTDSIRLNNPVAIEVNKREEIYVLDLDENGRGRIFVYDTTGKIKDIITKFNLLNPKSMAIDDKDNLFICDAGNKRILELSPYLTHIYSFGKEGDSLGQFRNPKSLVVTKDGRYLYVYDSGKRKIARFNMIMPKKGGGGGQEEQLVEIMPQVLMLFAPKPNPATKFVMLRYGVPRTERVSLTVYDIVGREAKTIINKIHKPGFYSAVWDGKDSRGRLLSAGVYFCLLKDSEKTITRKIVIIR